jgi:hypothetical protein
MRLELIEGKLSRSVPRGLGGSNPTWLLDGGRQALRLDPGEMKPWRACIGTLE